MLKKLLFSTIILGASLIVAESVNVKNINAEALTSTQKIQAKIAKQPKTITKAVSNLLSQNRSWADEYLSEMGSDDTYVIGDDHGFMMIPANSDGEVAAVTNGAGKVVRPAENVKDDVNAATVGEIKAAYNEALENDYKQYYPAAHYE